MTTIQVGGTYTFVYPDFGKSSVYQEYVNHSGQQLTVIREMLEGIEYDDPFITVGAAFHDYMFEVQCADGTTLHVWSSELSETE